MKEVIISVCMGSSCFARGNNRNIDIIRNYIEGAGVNLGVMMIKGNLCQGNCSKGPNISIDGVFYSGVLPENVCDIIRLHVGKT